MGAEHNADEAAGGGPRLDLVATIFLRALARLDAGKKAKEKAA